MFKFRSTIRLFAGNIANIYPMGYNEVLKGIVLACFTANYSKFLESTTEYRNVT
ncbi:hypothetical protein KAU32_09655 [bacterium]|nr:hypothetical protein [bacterium]